MFLLKLLLIIAWTLFYIPLTKPWKYPIILLLLINIYYQQKYNKTGKDVHKLGSQITLGIAVHSTLLGWVLLIGRGFKYV